MMMNIIIIVVAVIIIIDIIFIIISILITSLTANVTIQQLNYASYTKVLDSLWADMARELFLFLLCI